MIRLTVFLTERTYQQLVALTGARDCPQLIKRNAAQLLSFAIRAMFRPGLTITVRKPVLLDDASPTEE
jgi:hypothetical protein